MNKKILVVVAAIVLALVGGLVFTLMRLSESQKEKGAILEQMGYEKEQLMLNKVQLESDYVALSNDLEGFRMQINNDSILNKLNEEQNRVQLLLEELRSVKSTNIKRINELKSELGSVRKILAHYINQVDSLNKLNVSLQNQNIAVTKKYEETSKIAETLAAEKQQLSERVAIAAQLDARNIIVEQQTRAGKKANRISKTDLLKVSFNILKNITAKPGEKQIYLRILDPNNEVLESGSNGAFRFENRDILYSAKKTFEYSGQETSQTIFYTVVKTLVKGKYRADIFVDSHIIGTQEFEIKK